MWGAEYADKTLINQFSGSIADSAELYRISLGLPDSYATAEHDLVRYLQRFRSAYSYH